MMNTKTLLIGVAIGVAITVAASAMTMVISQQEAEAAASRIFRAQHTEFSTDCKFAGYGACQMIIAVPPREDGRTWSGTVSWTASKPIEVVIVHGYEPSIATGLESDFGEPMVADFGTGKVALTMLSPVSGTAVPSGSVTFAGDALVFHGHGDDPFTVTYTVDALAKRIDRDPCPFPGCF